jgi:pullulanase/glycogen debranching enzyme
MNPKAENFARELTNFVNSYGRNNEDFIQAFANEHRTLQQSAFRLFLQTIEFMASDNYRTDGRNEQSKEVAKKLLKGFEQVYHSELREKGVSEESLKNYTGEHFLPSKFLKYI